MEQKKSTEKKESTPMGRALRKLALALGLSVAAAGTAHAGGDKAPDVDKAKHAGLLSKDVNLDKIVADIGEYEPGQPAPTPTQVATNTEDKRIEKK